MPLLPSSWPFHFPDLMSFGARPWDSWLTRSGAGIEGNSAFGNSPKLIRQFYFSNPSNKTQLILTLLRMANLVVELAVGPIFITFEALTFATMNENWVRSTLAFPTITSFIWYFDLSYLGLAEGDDVCRWIHDAQQITPNLRYVYQLTTTINKQPLMIQTNNS